MKVDARLDAHAPERASAIAQELEEANYSGLWTSETAHDPFLPLAIAAEHTSRIELGCAIAVAFARNPMTVATVAHDLQRYSGGRFVLGLGTQVKPHIERRFSMPWSHPAARLGEFVEAVRAIIDDWESGSGLDFQGEFYRHTLMTPMFSPEPHGFGVPRIITGGVGPAMIRTAGRVSDGLFVHAFSTPDYLGSKVLPVIDEELRMRGRSRADFEVSCRGFLVTGRDEAELDLAKESVRQRLAFYGSTPAYRPVLEHHGWGELADQLNSLSRSDDPERWSQMAQLVDDEVIETFAVVAEPGRAGAEIAARYDGVADRYWFYTPYDVSQDLLAEVAADVGRARATSPQRM